MNTIATIAAKINAFADRFKITQEAVEVTSYQQMGPNVRVYFKLNLTVGKTPEQIAKLTQKVRLLNELVIDPFGPGAGIPDPEVTSKPVTSFDVTIPDRIYVGQSFTVTPDILPLDADDKTFTVTASQQGIVSILNGGTLITGLSAGDVQLTFAANGGDVADVTKLLNVELARIVATAVSTDFTGTTANVDDQFVIDTEVFSPLDSQEVIINVLTPQVIQKDGDTYTCIAIGECTIEIISVADASIRTNLNISVQA